MQALNKCSGGEAFVCQTVFNSLTYITDTHLLGNTVLRMITDYLKK